MSNIGNNRGIFGCGNQSLIKPWLNRFGLKKNVSFEEIFTHVCLQRPLTMTPVFCLMLNRICFSQNGNKTWSRAWASLCSGPCIPRNEANEGTYLPGQRSQWCHRGKHKASYTKGFKTLAAAIATLCDCDVGRLYACCCLAIRSHWISLELCFSKRTLTTNTRMGRESTLEMLGHSVSKFLS